MKANDGGCSRARRASSSAEDSAGAPAAGAIRSLASAAVRVPDALLKTGADGERGSADAAGRSPSLRLRRPAMEASSPVA